MHSNGFSLVRKIVLKDNHLDLNTKFDELQDSLGNTLLTPTRIYVRPVLEVLKQVDVHGVAHITRRRILREHAALPEPGLRY